MVLAAAGGAVLLAGAVAGGLYLLNQDDDKPERAAPAASATAPGSAQTPGGSKPLQTPAGPGAAAVDTNLGISLPIPDGWQRQETGERGNAYISTDPYPCTESPSGICVTAGVYTGTGSGSDPKAAAEQDIAKNAEESYGKSRDHRQTRAGKVTVAGQPGYLVRWRVDAAEGNDGYVQSVAFVSPVNGRMTIVRFGFDDTSNAPDLSLMDEILKGIRAVGPPNSA